jgi:hypothetical protein
MSSGYFFVDRGMFDHPSFAKEPFTEREAWVWMIAAAAWKPTRVRVGRSLLTLERGQLCFSERFLAEKWRWSRGRVRRFLDKLRTEQMVVTKTAHETTHITICNYNKYQVGGPTNSTSDGTSGGTTDGTKEEELKNTRKEIEARKRATRLPSDWSPSPEDHAFAKALGFSDQQIKFHADKFRDFWKGKPGAGGTKLDWAATWRNWMRTEDDRRPKPRPTDDWRNPLAGVR